MRILNKILGGLIIGLFVLIPLATTYAYCGDGTLETEKGEDCDDGNFAERDGCSSYCKIEDVTPPTVSSVSIANNATDVSTLTKTITVVFSEQINSTDVNKVNVQLTYAADQLDIDLKLGDDKKTITITINEKKLASEASHAIKLRNIRDLAGNAMKGEYDGFYISVFTTAKEVDTDPPNVVVTPPGDTYHFSQEVTMKAYKGSYTNSDDFLDDTAKIYYTLNDIDLSESSTVYSEPIQMTKGTTLRYFSVDGLGNKSAVYTERYSFKCPEYENAKKIISSYPTCQVLECDYGFILKSNTCVVNMGGNDPDDYKTNAATAPLFSSSTPMTIATKPAIYITKEHKGVIKRPIIFKDSTRGTILEFEQNTKITDSEGKPFSGYIKPPQNLYMKDYPINFGYTFRSIFEFKSAEGEDLQFDPTYKITIPYGATYNEDEKVMIFNYDSATQTYREYNRGMYDSDLTKKVVTIKAYKTGTFFIAQKGENFNKSIFSDVVTHWAKNYVEALYRKGIVQGKSKGIFAPNENLTRAEFIKVALKAIEAEVESPDDLDDAPFTDVPIYSWYAPYAAKAKELGLINGYEDGSFKPDQPINRAEAIKILFTAFGFDLTKRPVTESIMSKKRFIDLKSSEWYFPYADFAIQHGIMEGTPGNHHSLRYFHPASPITRGEMAKLAIKTMELDEELEKK